MEKDEEKFFHSRVYLYFYGRVKKKANGRPMISSVDLIEVFKRTFLPNVPKSIYYIIIKDMESLGLLKKIDRLKYQITGKNADNYLRRFMNFPF